MARSSNRYTTALIFSMILSGPKNCLESLCVRHYDMNVCLYDYNFKKNPITVKERNISVFGVGLVLHTSVLDEVVSKCPKYSSAIGE